MNTEISKYYLQFTWIVLSILFQTASAIVFKHCAITFQTDSLIFLFLNFWYFLGVMFLALQAITWYLALKYFSLSFAYPFMSSTFVLNMFSAWAIFHEDITSIQIIGSIFIAFGIVLLSRSPSL